MHPVTGTEDDVIAPGGGARLTIHVAAPPAVLPWETLHTSARSVLYRLLGAGDPELGAAWHDGGWRGHRTQGRTGLVPAGASVPVFPAAPRRRGAYMAGGPGTWEAGTPLRRGARALAVAAAGLETLYWAEAEWMVTAAMVSQPPPHLASGTTTWHTATPVIAKAASGRCLLPGDDGWEAAVAGNAAIKADTLGLPPQVRVELLGAGPKRSFITSPSGAGSKTGAAATVRVTADPRLLAALWCWGLGTANTAGMGWIRC